MEIKGRTISEVWEKSIEQVIKDKSPMVPTQHGTMAKELQNVIMVVTEPFREPRVSKKYSFPKTFRDEYSESLLEPYAFTDILHSRIYKYGESEVNQIDRCVKILQKDWHSRRAVITLWKPEEDLFSSFPPCICLFQIMIRQNKVDLVVIMRSNDAWLSAHIDMIALTNMQKEISKSIELECGRYIHHSISYHIYEFDYPKARAVFFV